MHSAILGLPTSRSWYSPSVLTHLERGDHHPLGRVSVSEHLRAARDRVGLLRRMRADPEVVVPNAV
jgi:hypothetical protein